MQFDDFVAGVRVEGLVAAGVVTVVAAEPHGDAVLNLVYRAADGSIAERLVTPADAAACRLASNRRWAFDADGAAFKLASEARRIRFAHLADPFSAVHSATIQPLPHQIEAVYGRLLPQQPLHFLLADDPGAGKTVMSGLFIRELMLRGDLERCLIVAPGSLVEQWQEELSDKFGLDFRLMGRSLVEESRSGNPFLEQPRLIARVDQLARSEELQAKLALADWDLVIVDEAHKMSARLYGDEVKRTLRFTLGELLRDRTRNLLLLTATPHNGSNEDFLLFLSLLDPDRFAGRLRNDASVPDVSDIMRRYVKENLLKFDGTKLFPERIATTLRYDLSPAEQRLYEAVTDYVQEGMGRAQAMQQGAEKRRGLAVGFALAALQRRLASSPAAIHHSLRRRCERLTKQLAEAQRAGGLEAVARVGGRVGDPDGFDADDYDDLEIERLEDDAIEQAMSADSIAELEREVAMLRLLERQADELARSRTDTKLVQLQGILDSEEFRGPGSERKLIVFTEHRDTLDYLVARTRTVVGNDAVVAIHGGLRREERRKVQDAFRNEAGVKVLIATDAAGEGVNLQRANLMVNYDLPWNPNRIEQRFGRIHRINQEQVCHLWNLVAHTTREGKVWERLLEKIETQRGVYGDQVYNVLGDPQINRSLQDLLLEAIQYGDDPEVQARLDAVIDADIGSRLDAVLTERALATDVLDETSRHELHREMEQARARKISPGFVRAFVRNALDDLGGRIAAREHDRFEITRVPAEVRSQAREVEAGGSIQAKYERVAFDKDAVSIGPQAVRAELICPGHPLLKALIATVIERHGSSLDAGTTFVDPFDPGDEVRVLLFLEHVVSDGQMLQGTRRVVSRRFQYVEVRADGTVLDPGAEPYINYEPLTDATRALVGPIDDTWADDGIEALARDWAIANLAGPHFDSVATMHRARVDRTRRAVTERLDLEIRHWDMRAIELKEQELRGKQPRLNSGRARQRADDLEARKARRLRELDLEADLVNHAPTVIAAAIVVPQGRIDRLRGATVGVADQELIVDTDRRAVAAVLAAERSIGREPVEQHHNNPGFDIASTDPTTGDVYQIEVKGHRPDTHEIKVGVRQVEQARNDPDRFRLAVVLVPNDPDATPTVRYFLRPFDANEPHPAQTAVTLDVTRLAPYAVEPR